MGKMWLRDPWHLGHTELLRAHSWMQGKQKQCLQRLRQTPLGGGSWPLASSDASMGAAWDPRLLLAGEELPLCRCPPSAISPANQSVRS